MTGGSSAGTLIGPWRSGQLRILCGAQVLAVAAVAIATIGATNTASFDEQTDWLNLAIAGIAFAALTAGAWLQLGRRRVIARRGRVAGSLAAAIDRPVAQGAGAFAPVATAEMSHYHRETCQLVRGKGAAPASVIEHHRAQRTPCAVCRP